MTRLKSSNSFCKTGRWRSRVFFKFRSLLGRTKRQRKNEWKAAHEYGWIGSSLTDFPMSFRGILDIVLHFENFRNVDLCNQGLYRLRARVYALLDGNPCAAVPFAKFSAPADPTIPPPAKDNHNFSAAFINPTTQDFSSRTFIIKYCEEEVELNDGVQFRLELDLAHHQSLYTPLFVEVDLMFAESKPKLRQNTGNFVDCNGGQHTSYDAKHSNVVNSFSNTHTSMATNGITAPYSGVGAVGNIAETQKSVNLVDNFKTVSYHVLKIHNPVFGVHECVPLVFDEYHFCVSRLMVHTCLSDFRCRMRPQIVSPVYKPRYDRPRSRTVLDEENCIATPNTTGKDCNTNSGSGTGKSSIGSLHNDNSSTITTTTTDTNNTEKPMGTVSCVVSGTGGIISNAKDIVKLDKDGLDLGNSTTSKMSLSDTATFSALQFNPSMVASCTESLSVLMPPVDFGVYLSESAASLENYIFVAEEPLHSSGDDLSNNNVKGAAQGITQHSNALRTSFTGVGSLEGGVSKKVISTGVGVLPTTNIASVRLKADSTSGMHTTEPTLSTTNFGFRNKEVTPSFVSADEIGTFSSADNSKTGSYTGRRSLASNLNSTSDCAELYPGFVGAVSVPQPSKIQQQQLLGRADRLHAHFMKILVQAYIRICEFFVKVVECCLTPPQRIAFGQAVIVGKLKLPGGEEVCIPGCRCSLDSAEDRDAFPMFQGEGMALCGCGPSSKAFDSVLRAPFLRFASIKINENKSLHSPQDVFYLAIESCPSADFEGLSSLATKPTLGHSYLNGGGHWKSQTETPYKGWGAYCTSMMLECPLTDLRYQKLHCVAILSNLPCGVRRKNRSGLKGAQRFADFEEGPNESLISDNSKVYLRIPKLSSRLSHPEYNCIAALLTQDLSCISGQVFEVWSKFLNIIPFVSAEICSALVSHWHTRLTEKFGEFILRESLCVDNVAHPPGDRSIFDVHDRAAEAVRRSQIRMTEAASSEIESPAMPVEDLFLHPIPLLQPILFEQRYVSATSSRAKGNYGRSRNFVAGMSTALPFAPKAYRGIHLFVFVHGFQGQACDLRLFKNCIALLYPCALFLLSESNEGRTEGDIGEMGLRLANEIHEKIQEWCGGGELLSRLSFIAHSLGGLIARAAMPHLESFFPKFHTFISLSSPHLGYMHNSNRLVEAGIWVLKKWRKSLSLQQLTMSDSKPPTDCYLYRLSLTDGLAHFNYVCLLSSCQDQYAAYSSARIEVGSQDTDGGRSAFPYAEMAHNILRNVSAEKLMRFDVNFSIPEKNLDTFIGRAAHIQFLESLPLIRMIVHTYTQLFR